jgi:Uma2 family endonuclease
MPTLVLQEPDVSIPGWVVDLDSFREWSHSDEFPETGRIDWLDGEVWADMSKEQLFTHNLVKSEMIAVLTALVKRLGTGYLFNDGAFLSNEAAGLGANPDLMFVSYDAVRTGRVRLVSGRVSGHVEVGGSPEMVLEVVSDSSARKDNHRLKGLYHRAGVREYWLVDVRGEADRFDILRRVPDGFVETPETPAGRRSEVFGGSFRLVRSLDPLGNPAFSLLVG